MDEIDVDFSCVTREQLVDSVMGVVGELIDDVKSQDGFISCSSLNFIHSDELLLTVGYSTLVLDFLKVILFFKCHCFSMLLRKNVSFELSFVKVFPKTEAIKWRMN